MHTTYILFSSPSPPNIGKLSLPYAMLLTIIFAHFNAPVYHLKATTPSAINTTSVKLVQLNASTSQPVILASTCGPVSSSTCFTLYRLIITSSFWFIPRSIPYFTTCPLTPVEFFNLNFSQPHDASVPPGLDQPSFFDHPSSKSIYPTYIRHQFTISTICFTNYTWICYQYRPFESIGPAS